MIIIIIIATLFLTSKYKYCDQPLLVAIKRPLNNNILNRKEYYHRN